MNIKRISIAVAGILTLTGMVTAFVLLRERENSLVDAKVAINFNDVAKRNSQTIIRRATPGITKNFQSLSSSTNEVVESPHGTGNKEYRSSVEVTGSHPENIVLTDGRIDGQKAGVMLMTNDFNNFIHQLRSTNSNDELAIDLTNLYSNEVRSELAAFDGIQLDDMSCGAIVCALTLSSTEGNSFEEFNTMLTNNENARVYAIMQSNGIDPSGIEWHHLLISTHPDASGIVMR